MNEINVMEAQTALRTFLEGVLIRRSERYIGFINKPKARKKFLAAFHHTLESDLDSSKSIKNLPVGSESIPGYWFAPPDEFGVPVADIREYVDSIEDSFLVVSANGKFGILSPETFIDSRRIYRV